MKIISRSLIAIVRIYQRWVSPLLGRHCRFLPSCSEYAVMAIEDWGAFRGSLLAAWRILRCHPFTAGGLDLPPRRCPHDHSRVAGAGHQPS